MAELKVSAWSASDGKPEVFLLGLVFIKIVQYYQAEIIQTCKSRYILVVRRNVMGFTKKKKKPFGEILEFS